MDTPVYLDNNATTACDPAVVEAMLPFLTEYWGNPSSSYRFGHQLAKHIEAARAKVAGLVNAEPREVIFTSCGTESNNSAIHAALALPEAQRQAVAHAAGHAAIRPPGALRNRLDRWPVEHRGAEVDHGEGALLFGLAAQLGAERVVGSK